MREVEKRGVLDGQHHWMAWHPGHSALTVGRQEFARRNIRIGDETVGRFASGPIFTRLVDRRSRLLAKRISQCLAAPIQPLVLEADLGEFFNPQDTSAVLGLSDKLTVPCFDRMTRSLTDFAPPTRCG